MDWLAPAKGVLTDKDHFQNSNGPGKKYPGDPSCVFKGKTVAAFAPWTEKGSITSEILVEILQTLEQLGTYDNDMAEGRVPILLLDVHGTRFQFLFFRCINNIVHEWVVCIGVPYGTALWQLGDSSEQNGCYKMACASMKRNLMQEKQKLMMTDLSVCPQEIMIIVNHAWEKIIWTKEQVSKINFR